MRFSKRGVGWLVGWAWWATFRHVCQEKNFRVPRAQMSIYKCLLRVDLNPRISKICASWMSVWNISANYVLVPLKFNLNWNIWNPFLKTSPLDFSGQRLGNTSLVVFLRFHSFSQVVKWPEFVRIDTTNIWRVYWQISLTGRGPTCLSWGPGFTPDRHFWITVLF